MPNLNTPKTVEYHITQELKDRWLSALRSGNYTQCADELHSVDNGFCCLGVLCDVMDSSKWVYEAHDNLSYKNAYKMNDVMTFTSRLASADDGWKTPFILPDHIQYQLTNFNDLEGMSFNEIADWVEANVVVDQGV